MRCPKCGSAVKRDDFACRKCGARLDGSADGASFSGPTFRKPSKLLDHLTRPRMPNGKAPTSRKTNIVLWAAMTGSMIPYYIAGQLFMKSIEPSDALKGDNVQVGYLLVFVGALLWIAGRTCARLTLNPENLKRAETHELMKGTIQTYSIISMALIEATAVMGISTIIVAKTGAFLLPMLALSGLGLLLHLREIKAAWDFADESFKNE